MTTPPNPQQLLRRPKKQTLHSTANGKIAAVSAAAVLGVAAIIGFAVANHAKSAANQAIAPVSVHVAAAAPQDYALSLAAHSVKHGGTKPAANAKPKPGDTPTPSATPTPVPTPTPANAQAAQKSPLEIAKAKHAAALRLAALRRGQSATQVASTGTFLNASGSGINTAAGIKPANLSSQPAQAVPTAAPTIASNTAPQPDSTPIYAPRVVVDARFIDRIEPAYPDIAREQGAQGTVIVLATVGPKGNVISVDVAQSSGNRLLDQAALSAARSSRFAPPEIDGRPATETYRIVYTFDLNQ